jgi:hypothetical protein
VFKAHLLAKQGRLVGVPQDTTNDLSQRRSWQST